jgi:hypothetical protein
VQGIDGLAQGPAFDGTKLDKIESMVAGKCLAGVRDKRRLRGAYTLAMLD